jgi:hypothetical protein
MELGADAIDAVGPMLALLDTDLLEEHRYDILGAVRVFVSSPALPDALCDDLPTLGSHALPEALHLLEWAHREHKRVAVIDCVRRALENAMPPVQLRMLRGLDGYEPWEGEWLALAKLMAAKGGDQAVRDYAAEIEARSR